MKAPWCQVEFYEGFCGSVPSPFYLLNKHTTVQECVPMKHTGSGTQQGIITAMKPGSKKNS